MNKSLLWRNPSRPPLSLQLCVLHSMEILWQLVTMVMASRSSILTQVGFPMIDLKNVTLFDFLLLRQNLIEECFVVTLFSWPVLTGNSYFRTNKAEKGHWILHHSSDTCSHPIANLLLSSSQRRRFGPLNTWMCLFYAWSGWLWIQRSLTRRCWCRQEVTNVWGSGRGRKEKRGCLELWKWLDSLLDNPASFWQWSKTPHTWPQLQVCEVDMLLVLGRICWRPRDKFWYVEDFLPLIWKASSVLNPTVLPVQNVYVWVLEAFLLQK